MEGCRLVVAEARRLTLGDSAWLVACSDVHARQDKRDGGVSWMRRCRCQLVPDDLLPNSGAGGQGCGGAGGERGCGCCRRVSAEEGKLSNHLSSACTKQTQPIEYRNNTTSVDSPPSASA